MSRQEMIERQLKSRGIKNSHVLRAIEEVDRSLFVPKDMKSMAYDDSPLPIGYKQTISQPYIVAYMADVLEVDSKMRVLEVGSGCGYNAAILSRLAAEVYSVEIVKELATLAKDNLSLAGIENVYVRNADGHLGLPSLAPFDRIVVTASTPEIPDALKNQLGIGGKLLAPVGEGTQELVLLEKDSEGHLRENTLMPVRFVPMTTFP